MATRFSLSLSNQINVAELQPLSLLVGGAQRAEMTICKRKSQFQKRYSQS
jgi:hypothetical protein